MALGAFAIISCAKDPAKDIYRERMVITSDRGEETVKVADPLEQGVPRNVITVNPNR